MRRSPNVAATCFQQRPTRHTHCISRTGADHAGQVGLDQKMVKTWVRRYPYGTTAVSDEIVRSQQFVADAFYGARLIPQKITVRDNLWQSPVVAAALAAQ
ncbi:hypothetical protein LMG28614_04217 [Paraburkholderia ultramafica]|uniref:Uncharacterized protein n=1 Tax=Paraburkholderia ultramafica TaxID=1544867 RepID=A0A6S7BVL1_9BURK|nr:hypothetical protein [Paraburkholderia ultramafica]CAB3795645.1 hypothetical protein LMG28614_04217 [Paraburkholderia ultramafica]